MATKIDCLQAFGCISLSLFASASAAEQADWQWEMLIHPSQQQIALEEKGRVFIYDGLRDQQVEAAMDKDFDRIGSMMFVRTLMPPAGGEPEYVVDDGCN